MKVMTSRESSRLTSWWGLGTGKVRLSTTRRPRLRVIRLQLFFLRSKDCICRVHYYFRERPFILVGKGEGNINKHARSNRAKIYLHAEKLIMRTFGKAENYIFAKN